MRNIRFLIIFMGLDNKKNLGVPVRKTKSINYGGGVFL